MKVSPHWFHAFIRIPILQSIIDDNTPHIHIIQNIAEKGEIRHNRAAMNSHLRTLFVILTIIFAGIGLLFTLVFLSMHFGLLNVRGSITERNAFFQEDKKEDIKRETTKQEVTQTQCISEKSHPCAWNETAEWSVVREGLRKDAEIISRVAGETQTHPRIIASIVVPEQIRFFTSEREVFKRYFEPLKILGSLSQFSLGVTGIKQETAEYIELYAKDTTSPFYPGEHIAPLLSYVNEEEKQHQLYLRLTDAKNHYYSYLYTGAFITEITSQWKSAGYDISKNPGILTTLFNLGFTKSIPKENPIIGGAVIETGGRTYTYGELGALFFSSSELEELFKK
jgi:hypothetical protein